MADYKCGHDSKTVIMNTNIFSLTHYFKWLHIFGKKNIKCHECYVRKHAKADKEDV